MSISLLPPPPPPLSLLLTKAAIYMSNKNICFFDDQILEKKEVDTIRIVGSNPSERHSQLESHTPSIIKVTTVVYTTESEDGAWYQTPQSQVARYPLLASTFHTVRLNLDRSQSIPRKGMGHIAPGSRRSGRGIDAGMEGQSHVDRHQPVGSIGHSHHCRLCQCWHKETIA